MLRTIFGGAALLVALPVSLGISSEQESNSKGPVLDWGASYWRYFLTYRPPQFSDGGKLRHYARGWHVGHMSGKVVSADPPADWMTADFDDSLWPRVKGSPPGGDSWYDPVVRVKRARGSFQVSDPAKVSALKLDIEYLGGVAVFLNGQEVARGHLPSGPLTGDTFAEGYPPEAYAWDIPIAQSGYPVPVHEWKPTGDPKSERWRTISVSPNPKLLRKGENVLAVSLHKSGYGPYAQEWHTEAMNGHKKTPWPHLMIRKLRFDCTPPAAIAPPGRPHGVHVDVADIHQRIANRDFIDLPHQPPVLRLVGARNGTYSGQVLVSTTSPLSGVSASASDLTGPGKIPSGAVSLRYGVGSALTGLRESHFDRHQSYFMPPAWAALYKYGAVAVQSKDRVSPGPELMAEAGRVTLFDHLAEKAPSQVPADNVQPIWVTVKVPKDAPPGFYTGTLTVQAGGAKNVAIRFQVIDWTLPEPNELASFVGLQHSLWGPAAQYKVAPWSEGHWKAIEKTMQRMTEVGNDLAVLPLIVDGEEANPQSLVPWIRKGSGYEYDWKILDRYLELVARHWGKKAAIIGEICWVPFTGKGQNGWEFRHSAVSVGTEKLPLPLPSSPEWSGLFVPFARAVRDHVKAKGFESFYWGWFYDYVHPELKVMMDTLAKEVPGALWARASHEGFRKQPAQHLDMHIRVFPQSFNRAGDPESRYGWKNPNNLLFPRNASEVMAIGPFDSPMAMRWLTENCLVNGAAGFGRLCADFWPPHEFKIWYHPFVPYLLHPGPEGAEGGVNFEMLREGIQEAEARIWLEKSGKDQAEPAKSVLADRIRALGALPTGPKYTGLGAYYAGWQERSWDLYAAAAAGSGGKAPSPSDKEKFFGSPSASR